MSNDEGQSSSWGISSNSCGCWWRWFYCDSTCKSDGSLHFYMQGGDVAIAPSAMAAASANSAHESSHGGHNSTTAYAASSFAKAFLINHAHGSTTAYAASSFTKAFLINHAHGSTTAHAASSFTKAFLINHAHGSTTAHAASSYSPALLTNGTLQFIHSLWSSSLAHQLTTLSQA